MSEQVPVGRGPNGGYIYTEVFSSEEIVEQLKASPEWQAFKDRFDMSVESNHTLLGWLYADKLGDDPGVEDYQRLLKNIISSGGVVTVRGTTYAFELRPAEPEQQPEPEVPRDKNGNTLTSSQLEWRSFAIWSNDPNTTSEMIRQKRQTDRSFAEFYKRSLLREAQETPSTQFSLAGQPSTESKPAVTPELIAFAQEYRNTSMQEVRKRRNPTFNLNAAQYEQNFQAALAAGLI
jgi:hypothetical protein